LIGISEGALMPATPSLAKPRGGIRVGFPVRHVPDIRTGGSAQRQHTDNVADYVLLLLP
jgi:hypothetical protein